MENHRLFRTCEPSLAIKAHEFLLTAMKRLTLTFCFCLASILGIYAEDLRSLNDSLQQQPEMTNPPNRSFEQSSPKSRNENIKQNTKSSKAATEENGASRAEKGILHPMDKFPNQVTGLRVAGDFLPKFLENDGVVLVAAADYLNPFARQFIVTNVRTGLNPGQIVNVNAPALIHVSPSKPFIIISKGLIPGTYMVNAQEPLSR